MKYGLIFLLVVFLTSCFREKDYTLQNEIIHISNLSEFEMEMEDLRTLRQKGEIDIAFSKIQNIEKRYPNSSEVFEMYAFLYMEKKDFINALEYLNKSYEIDKGKKIESPYTYYNFAVIYHKMHDILQAELFIDKAIKMNPQNSEFLKFKSELMNQIDLDMDIIRELIQGEKYQDAIEKSEEVIINSQEKETVIIYNFLAFSYLKLQDYKMSESYYKKLLILSKKIGQELNFDTLFNISILYKNLGDDDLANFYKLEAKKIVSSEDERNRLEILTLGSNQDEVITVITEDLEGVGIDKIYVDGTEISKTIDIELEKVEELFNQQDYINLEKQLLSLNKLYPNHPTITYWLGRTYLYVGKTIEAEKYYTMSNILKPNSPLTLLGIAWSSHRNGKSEEALEYLDLAIKLDPYYEDAYYAKNVVEKERTDEK